MDKNSSIKKRFELLIEANQARLDYRWKDAISLYSLLIEAESNDIDIMYMLAQIYFSYSLEQSDLDLGGEALKWIKKAIQLNAKKDEFYVVLGNIYHFALDTPHYELAEQSFRRALLLNSSSIDARMGLANLVNVPENLVPLVEAIDLLEDATIIEPQNPFIFLRLGTLYIQANRLEDAYISYNRALMCSTPLPFQYGLEIKQNVTNAASGFSR